VYRGVATRPRLSFRLSLSRSKSTPVYLSCVFVLAGYKVQNLGIDSPVFKRHRSIDLAASEYDVSVSL
jgi:hypothetical protein